MVTESVATVQAFGVALRLRQRSAQAEPIEWWWRWNERDRSEGCFRHSKFEPKIELANAERRAHPLPRAWPASAVLVEPGSVRRDTRRDLAALEREELARYAIGSQYASV